MILPAYQKYTIFFSLVIQKYTSNLLSQNICRYIVCIFASLWRSRSRSISFLRSFVELSTTYICILYILYIVYNFFSSFTDLRENLERSFHSRNIFRNFWARPHEETNRLWNANFSFIELSNDILFVFLEGFVLERSQRVRKFLSVVPECFRSD